MNRQAYISHEKGKWCVRSEDNPDWNGGCYDSESAARKRLKEVEMFKHMKGNHKEVSMKISERIASIDRYLAADEEPETEEQEKAEEPEEEERVEEPKEKEEPAEEEEVPEEAKDFTIEDDEDATDVLEQAQGMALELLEGIVNFTIEQDGNPPAWVKDKAIWEKAKEAVEPYKENYDNPIAVSVAVYKSMGGTIKKK